MDTVTLKCIDADMEKTLNDISRCDEKIFEASKRKKALNIKLRKLRMKKWKLNVNIVKRSGTTKAKA